jgi:hypothetical protein
VAEAFFDACETGKGWAVCNAYCTPDATFSAQAEPLLDVKTLAQYIDWMTGILTVLPDAHYELKFVRDRQQPEQRRRLWRVPRHSQGRGRSGCSDRPANQHGLRLRNAI